LGISGCHRASGIAWLNGLRVALNKEKCKL